MANVRFLEMIKRISDDLPQSEDVVIVAEQCLEGVEFALQNKFDEALKRFEKALERAPLCETIKTFRKVIADVMTNGLSKEAVIHFFRGVVYDFDEKPEKAIAELKKVLSIKPDFIQARENLGAIYTKNKMYNEAINEYRKIIELVPDSAKAHLELGKIYLIKKMYNEAEKEFKKALELDPKNVYAHYYMGEVYLAKEEYDNAISEYASAVALNSSYSEALDSLVLIYCWRNRYSLSIKA